LIRAAVAPNTLASARLDQYKTPLSRTATLYPSTVRAGKRLNLEEVIE